MKKFFYFAAALALVACSNNDYLGNSELNKPVDPEGAINFSFSKSGMKKAPGAGDAVGATAADLLGKRFIVYGTKHFAAEVGDAAQDSVVFDNFQVTYAAGTAGTTESNTANWDYVGKTSLSGASQAVKYWDLSAVAGYTFYAFSAAQSDLKCATDHSSDKVIVTKVTEDPAVAPAVKTVYAKGYTVEIKNGALIDSIYFSDRVNVAKAQYGQTVNLTFRRLGAQVRVGFYETVPGYDVKIDHFYFANETSPAAPHHLFGTMDQTGAAFTASVQNIKAPTASAPNTLTVTYFDNNSASENRVSVTNSGATSQYTLTLGNQITTATKIGETSATATFDNGGDYTTIYPMEGNATNMLVRMDYTLTANDGTNDIIHVKNARVVVPAELVQWKANTAYTYLFKISNNTNGTTGTMPGNPDNPGQPYIPVIDPVTGDTTGYIDPVNPTDTIPVDPSHPFPPSPVVPEDPEGLFPITFDAVVAATEDGLHQQTITSVATNNVTTYADDTIVNEYKAGKAIYVVNTNTVNHSVIRPSAIGTAAGNAQVYKLGTTARTEAEVLAQLFGNPMGVDLDNPAGATIIADGKFVSNGSTFNFGTNGVVKFTPAAAGYYAYVYCTTAHVGATYATAASATYADGTKYYFKTAANVYYLATGINAENFETNKANLYTQTSAGVAGVYDVKVIKVQ